jgi:ubiquinone/menaquinone biosynthesis C-methylase UbiE/uncharacterized protein YbaR (Trm112 family)
MHENLAQVYICPKTRGSLKLVRTNGRDQEIVQGTFMSSDGTVYPIEDGIPYFIFPGQLGDKELQTQNQYDNYYTAEFYQNAIDWQFASLYEDEHRVREFMVDQLALKPDACVLEVGCGTGMDSFRIAQRLFQGGELFLQDLARRMVTITRDRLSRDYDDLSLACTLHYFVSSATYLPFPDDYFDAVFHFGGFNNFEHPKAAFAEFARVTKTGGKVVVGDEGVAPWLRGTTFGEIVITNNPLFKDRAPLEHLPDSARDVTVRWIMANCFYLIDFVVGDGPPKLNLNLPHKGRRGGTMRTRYYGQLEGVTVETKELAWKAAERRGISMHEWLDRLVRAAAERDLEDE